MQTKAEAGKKLILMGLLAFTLLTPNAAFSETDFNKFVVFGTSLSDPGNFFQENSDLNVAPSYNLDPLGIPESPYAVGGHHMTNGATWIEQLARPLGMQGSVLPASRDENPNAMNYAVDGSRAAPSDLHNRTVLLDQRTAYFTDVGNVASPDAMHAIEIGSNDVRDALAAFLEVLLATGDFGAAQAAASNISVAALNQIAIHNQALYIAGARQFLYVNAPPLDVAPAVIALDDAVGIPGLVLSAANTLSAQFNLGLDFVFGLLPADAAVTKLNLFDLTTDIVSNPADFGLTNVTEACIIPDEEPFICQVPHEYLFWDVVHPTKVGHSFIAEEGATALGIN